MTPLAERRQSESGQGLVDGCAPAEGAIFGQLIPTALLHLLAARAVEHLHHPRAPRLADQRVHRHEDGVDFDRRRRLGGQSQRDGDGWAAAWVGRATVLALRLNNEYVVESRLLWTAYGWHPPQGTPVEPLE